MCVGCVCVCVGGLCVCTPFTTPERTPLVSVKVWPLEAVAVMVMSLGPTLSTGENTKLPENASIPRLPVEKIFIV